MEEPFKSLLELSVPIYRPIKCTLISTLYIIAQSLHMQRVCHNMEIYMKPKQRIPDVFTHVGLCLMHDIYASA